VTTDIAPGPAPEPNPSRLRDRLETILAIMLGLAAVLVAVSGFQGALRGGESIASYNDGIRSINDANAYFNEAVQVQNRDQAVFLEFAKAVQSEDEDMVAYLRTAIMDDNLRGAVDEWVNDESDEILSPLTAPSYQLPQQVEGERLAALTGQQFEQARALDDKGDKYDLVGVIVASSLFFLGIAAVVSNMRTKVAGAALGTVTLVVASVMWLMV
jgi:hypothetical protein